MSLIIGIVSRVDINIDRQHARTGEGLDFETLKENSNQAYDRRKLQTIARALSVENHGLLPCRKLLDTISQAQNDKLFAGQYIALDEEDINEQAWFLVSKFTTQTVGVVLSLLLEQSSSIGVEIDYWDDVLGSSLYTGHYTVQTAPSRIWLWITDICSTVRTASARENLTSFKSITSNWGLFYQTVQRTVQRNLSKHTRNAVLSFFSRHRAIIRKHRQTLDQLQDLNASAVGILLEEYLTFAGNDQSPDTNQVIANSEWCSEIYKTVLLMENILQNLSEPLETPKNLEDSVFLVVDNKIRENRHLSVEESPMDLDDIVERLIHILKSCIPTNVSYHQSNIRKHGRPSILVRYWFPTAVILMSLSTSLRILTNRRAEIMRWLSELGVTIVDFWRNWVLQPTQKLIGTIRHDEQSEIAIMSRNSLEADRQSLERMVIDFISDHSSWTANENLQSNVNTIISQVREGDLTLVLKAYERDLRKPFLGTVRGDLVRALLIQIQKTKVDVEIAMGGIDSLLRSQELVFGFIGLTPGLLITYGTVRWMSGFFDNRRGFRAGIEKQRLRSAIWNIDRILGAYPSTPDSVLSYKDYGLCINGAQILRQKAQYLLPRSLLSLFQQDLTELADLNLGVSRQRNILHRIQWTYSKWI